MAYDWPGNVRQLENLIERAIIMAKGNTIYHIDLSDDLRRRKNGVQQNLAVELPFKEAKKMVVRDYEKEYFINLLRRCKGNITQSSRMSDLDMKTLRRKMIEYGLQKGDFKNRD
jgi:DNA-binding NtrC family response regulator